MTKYRRFFLPGILGLSVLTSTLFSAPVFATKIPEITNMAEIAKALKLDTFKNKKFSRKIKIAVLDNGFNGWEAEKGKGLPQNTEYRQGAASDADKIETPSFHGLFMAMMLVRVIKESKVDADYELVLFNSYGYTKFADAVDTVVKEQFDLVLYSQVWEFGGNGDGKGFINTIVAKATEAGVIWINAAGNFGRLTRLAPVVSKSENDGDFVTFTDKKGKASDGVTITCAAPAKSKCQLRLVLSWNDFKDDKDLGTDKDLDLILLNSKNVVVKASDLNQGLTANPTDPKSSVVPRELIELEVDPGTYKARVKLKSRNFDAAKDKLRVTASGVGVDLRNPDIGETLLPPGDQAGVIVIGASDDIQTSSSVTMKRPDIYLKSVVKLKDGSAPFSTSNAAALAAGVAGIHLGLGVEKNRQIVIEALKTISQKAAIDIPVAEKPASPVRPAPQVRSRTVQGLRAPPRRAQPARYDESSFDRDEEQFEAAPQSRPRQQYNCIMPSRLPYMHATASWLLRYGGGVPIHWRGRPVIAVNYDFGCYNRICAGPGERLFASPQGVVVLEQQFAFDVPPDYYEIVSGNFPICSWRQ
jgi:hypothetical protein